MPKFAGPADIPENHWFRKGAYKMAREGKSLLQVIEELCIDGVNSREADLILKSNTFQTILRNERLRYANEVARDPELRKETAAGMMLICVQNLIGQGEWDKATEALLKLSKLQGWVGAESNVNVFTSLQGLKGHDLEELKKKVESERIRATTGTSIN